MSNCNSCNSCKKKSYNNDEAFKLNIKLQIFQSPLNKNKITMNVIHGPSGLIVNGSGYNRLVLQKKLFDEIESLLEEIHEYGSIDDPKYYSERFNQDY